VFDLIRHQRHGENAVMVAFDLIGLDGEDLRRTPIERRKDRLLRLIRDQHPGICSTLTTLSMAAQCSRTPARSAAKASCRSGSARPIALVARRIG
jgi:ATP-dependent DNA ligase